MAGSVPCLLCVGTKSRVPEAISHAQSEFKSHVRLHLKRLCVLLVMLRTFTPESGRTLAELAITELPNSGFLLSVALLSQCRETRANLSVYDQLSFLLFAIGWYMRVLPESQEVTVDNGHAHRANKHTSARHPVSIKQRYNCSYENVFRAAEHQRSASRSP